jgi:site-specific recombinase XerC
MSPMMEAGMTPPNAGKKYPAEVLTAEEVQALMGACSARSASGIRNRALIALLYRSGLRVSEIVALRPSDVDLRKHGVRVLHGKGDKATTRGFHPSCDDALARWIDTRKGLGLKNGPLFCTLAGGPVSDQYVRNLLHRLGRQAGVDKRVHPHGLRHTYAVELERAWRAGQPDIQAARAQLDRRYEPVSRSPEQRRGDRGARGRRPARAPRLGLGQRVVHVTAVKLNARQLYAHDPDSP